jgi:hypothetical protein
MKLVRHRAGKPEYGLRVSGIRRRQGYGGHDAENPLAQDLKVQGRSIWEED